MLCLSINRLNHLVAAAKRPVVEIAQQNAYKRRLLYFIMELKND